MGFGGPLSVMWDRVRSVAAWRVLRPGKSVRRLVRNLRFMAQFCLKKDAWEAVGSGGTSAEKRWDHARSFTQLSAQYRRFYTIYLSLVKLDSSQIRDVNMAYVLFNGSDVHFEILIYFELVSDC